MDLTRLGHACPTGGSISTTLPTPPHPTLCYGRMSTCRTEGYWPSDHCGGPKRLCPVENPGSAHLGRAISGPSLQSMLMQRPVLSWPCSLRSYSRKCQPVQEMHLLQASFCPLAPAPPTRKMLNAQGSVQDLFSVFTRFLSDLIQLQGSK